MERPDPEHLVCLWRLNFADNVTCFYLDLDLYQYGMCFNQIASKYVVCLFGLIFAFSLRLVCVADCSEY